MSQKTTLKPFLDFIISLKQDLPVSIPILRDLALLETESGKASGVLRRRIERRYLRLCRVQGELGRLDLKKAALGVSPEDYIFSQIDFSRYREIKEADFIFFFKEGITDFDKAFFKKNFGLDHGEIRSLIEKSYEKADGIYVIKHEDFKHKNPKYEILQTLSIMRTLETSLEDSPLFTAEEIGAEIKSLVNYLGGNTVFSPADFRNTDKLFALLVLSLDNVIVTHRDGMKTKLFISPKGDLSGTFRPGDKPWTKVLIPAKA